ncbi:MAG: ArsA family ATPase [Myxococcales bacterium]|nr:ArsA family ATPase [Myxococcales bacterium]
MDGGLSQRLATKRIVLCVGSGGVGKTTLAAAIALQGAMAGRKTLVLTIDPARRLANSLGLERLDNTETRISPAVFQRAGLEPKAELWGMMLDVKRSFDDLIRRIAPTDEAAERILDNHYYQNLSDALAGSQEYMAMEKLHELQAERDYDLLVVDTPPTKHALDFLEAPNRMADFLDGKVIQWFIKPYLLAGKVGFAFAQRSAGMIFKMLERFTGYEAMADLAEFFLAFDGMYDGFKERAVHVKRLLASPQTAFVLVTSPVSPAIDEARFFWRRLTHEKMAPEIVVFNRVHTLPVDDPQTWAAQARQAARKVMARFPHYAPAIDVLLENAAGLAEQAAADDQAMRRFLAETEPRQIHYRVPALTADVHDLRSLAELGAYLV